MDDVKRQFNDLVVELYRTNFENGLLKLNNFVESNPGISEDPELQRNISILSAESFATQGDINEALKIYRRIWEGYSAQASGYLPVGLAITQLYLKLPDTENARLFAKRMVTAMKMHGFENHDLAACIYLARIAFPFDENDSTVQSFIDYANKELGMNLAYDAKSRELEELENKLRQEGQALTAIIATAGSVSKVSTIQSLEEFLESAITPAFRREASRFLENLRKN